MNEKNIIHKDLAHGRWFTFSLMEQLANIGSDVERTIQWKNKNNKEYSQKSLDRVLELIDLTIADKKNIKRLKEIVRAREMLVSYFIYDNEYSFTDKYWQEYFFNFAYAVAVSKGK